MPKLNLLMIGCLFIMSCSANKTYFNSELKKDLEASNIDIKKVQFYVDRDVVLQRQIADKNAQVKGGEIKMENGSYVHVIKLKKGTPGVVTRVYNNRVDVSFEVGDKRYLTFGEVAVNRDKTYALYADSWLKGLGAVKYDGYTYYVLPEGGGAKLLVKKSSVNKSQSTHRSMGGRKV